MSFFSKRRAFTLTELAIVIGIAGTVLGSIWVAYGRISQTKKVEQAASEIRYIVNKTQNLLAVNPNVLEVKQDPGCLVKNTVCPATPSCVAPYPTPANFPGCGTYPNCSPCSNPAPCTPGVSTENPWTYPSISSLGTGLTNSGIFPSEMLSVVGGTTVISSPWSTNDVSLIITEAANDCNIPANAPAIAAAEASISNSPTSTSVSVPSAVTPTYNFPGQGAFELRYSKVPISACVQLVNAHATEWLNMGLSQIVMYNGGISSPTAADMTLSNIIGWCNTYVAQYGDRTTVLTLTFQPHN